MSSRPMVAPARPRRFFTRLTLLSVAVAVIVGSLILVRKLGAQPRTPPQRFPSVASAQPGASSAPVAAPPSGGTPDGPREADHEEHTSPALEYAELGPNSGVPVHNEGNFRSPFAHPRAGPPANVRVGMQLVSVRDYDIQKATFEADFFLSFTSDRPMPDLDPAFLNGKEESRHVLASTPTFKLMHILGTFYSPPDLHRYPFDTQELLIEIEDDLAGVDQVRLVADREHTHLAPGFTVAGWEVESLEAHVVTHSVPPRFDHDDLAYSRYELRLGVTRFGTSAAFGVFVPAIVIVLISLAGLWIPREELEVRSNSSAPMLAAAVLFHFALMQELPATEYLTRADKLMMAVYASLLLNMLLTWLWFVVDPRHTQTIFVWGKRVLPVVTIVILLIGSLA